MCLHLLLPPAWQGMLTAARTAAHLGVAVAAVLLGYVWVSLLLHL
jgi:hypothetical protein